MAKTVYTQEMQDFILDNYEGISTKELTARFNETFGVEFRASQIRAYKSNHHLRSGGQKGFPSGTSKTYPDEIKLFIYENHKGVGPSEMPELVEKAYGVRYTASQMKGFYGRYGLNSGVTGRFEKGHPSHNKGKKGQCAPGCEKGWFKKGHMPQTHREVGSERVNIYGYIEVKVAEPNKWRAKHHLVWEEHNGPIPKGHIIYFKDGNPQNIDIENLRLVSRKVHAVMNHTGLSGFTGERQEAAFQIADAKIALAKAKKVSSLSALAAI